MWQLPAIFLQHAISDAVICEWGRQASAGVASQSAIRHSAKIERQHVMTECYISSACEGKHRSARPTRSI